jgi:hypothetical protein
VAGVTTFSGNYNHLFNKPTIPSNNNQLTNGAGYITSNVSGNLTLGDNDEIQFGDDNDAKIQVDGSANFIMQGDSTTYLRGSSVQIGANGGSGGYYSVIKASAIGTKHAELYNDFDLRLETTSTGVDVNGNITVSGTVDGVDVAALSSTVAGIDTSGFPSGTIPTNNNQLANGAGYITASSVPTNNNQLTNGAGYITASSVPTNNNQLTNGAGYITGYTVTSSDVTGHQGDITITESQISDFGTYATTASLATVATSGSYNDLSNKPTIPSNNNQLTNGAGYITASSVPTNNNQLTNGQGFITGYTVTSSDVTQHEGDITITESQISDLGTYLTSSDLSSYATQSYVNTQVSNLVDSAPSTLDTLNELAAALGDDANFSTTVTDSIATKMPLAGGTFTGAVTFASGQTFDYNNLTNTPTVPTNNNQLTNGAGYITNSVSGDLTLTDTATDSSAGPEFVLYRNSSSPSSADYIGQIKFQGESTSGATRLYAKITGKIGDPTNGSEDGIIEIAHRKNGSNNISGRWNQDELQLLNGTELSLGDSQKIKVGTGDDLSLYHNGTNSFIDNATGSLYIRGVGDDLYLRATDDIFIQPNGNVNGITVTSGGSVDLYHNANKKFETTSTGVQISGQLEFGDGSGAGGTNKLTFGASDDLNIFHDGSHSYIKDTGTGNLKLVSNGTAVQIEKSDGENIAIFRTDGSVDLFYDNSKKFETTSSGVTVTGTVSATAFSGDGSSLTGITASNADTVDNLHASQFLRSDANDTVSGNLDFTSTTAPITTNSIKFNNSEMSSSYYTEASGVLAFDENFYQDTEYGTDTYSPNSVFTGGNGGGILIKNEDGWGAVFTSQNTRWASAEWDNLTIDGNQVWHAGNDGSGSGLDADTVDGVQASSFLRSDASDVYNCNGNSLQFDFDDIGRNSLVFTLNGSTRWQLVHDNSGNNLNFSRIAGGGQVTINGSRILTIGDEGSGNGIDADTVDGIQASSFLRSDANDSFSGDLTGSGTILTTGTFMGVKGDGGGVVMTTNDGYGNANLCFNHQNGVPDKSGSSCRIETSVDNSTGFFMFEVGNSVTGGTATTLTNVLKLETSQITAYKNIVCSGDITSNSDISLKDNVVTYENALDKILAMRGVEYDRNDLDGKHEVGLIAQEVEKIIPEVVGESEDGIKNIAYGKLTAVLIEAIKEQQQQINDLRQQLNKGK